MLAPYLPQAAMSASPFSEGGALYALGIIHANHGAEIRSYLLDALRNAGTNETVQHGAALGIGCARPLSRPHPTPPCPPPLSQPLSFSHGLSPHLTPLL